MFNYTEIVQNGKYDRGQISELPEGYRIYDIDYYGQDIGEAYNSVYYHSKEFLDYVKETGAVRGYRGKIWTDCLVWDFDGPEISAVYQEVERFIDYLTDECGFKSRNMRLYYSGNKGYHLIYYSPELSVFDNVDMQPIIKKLCVNIADGFSFVDDSIYDCTRIFRSINSKHPTTGRYKIEIPLIRMDVDDILELAKTQQECEEFNPDTEQDNTIIAGYKKIIELVVEIKKDKSKFTAQDLEDIFEYGFTEGNTNNEVMRICGLFHSRNISDNIIESILGLINDKSKVPVPSTEISKRVSAVSNYSVDQQYVVPEGDEIIDFKQAGEEWKKLIELSGDFSFGPRYPHLNDVMSVTLLGDMVGIVASSGVGKSTLLMDLVNEYAEYRDCTGLILSLEMSQSALFFRGATISYKPDEMGDVDSKELAYELLHNDDLRNHISEEWSRLKIVDRGLNIEQIDQYIKLAKQKYPDTRIVAIDYMQNIDDMTEISKSMKIARELKNVAKRNQVIIVNAVQTNKLGSNPYNEVEDAALEGASALRQSHDYLCAFWKSTDNRRRLHGKFLKTRWSGAGCLFDLERDGLKYKSYDYEKDQNPNVL